METPSSDTDEPGPPILVPRRQLPPPLPRGRGIEADLRSLERHVCDGCGGKGEWNPAKTQLVCPYCGKHFVRNSPPPLPDLIVEHDLDLALACIDAGAGQADPTERRVQCGHCHAVIVRSVQTVARHCDFCGSPELLDYQDISSPVPPESLLPASVSQEKAYHALKAFLASKWFAPNDLKRRNLIERIQRVYLPYWTFDAAAECPWTAESGTYYYVTVTSRDSQGRTVSRQERRIRWQPSSGQISTSFDDIVVSGSRGLDAELLTALEPFPTHELVPYETRFVSGWQVEHYQVPLSDASRSGFGVMEATLREMCGREVPGDTYRNLRIQPEYSNKTFKHILVPIWLLGYQYRGKTWQGAVNAVTGKAHALYPMSGWKIAFCVIALLNLIAAIIEMLRQA